MLSLRLKPWLEMVATSVWYWQHCHQHHLTYSNDGEVCATVPQQQVTIYYYINILITIIMGIVAICSNNHNNYTSLRY